VLPWCRARGIATVAYSPLGSGEFVQATTPRGRVLAGIAKKHGVTPHQVALAWLAREPDVFVIPKATALAHVRENAAAADLVLDDDDVGAIDRACPRGRSRALPTL
jgi:diketogulonate reductase-like aldo/keto reductase